MTDLVALIGLVLLSGLVAAVGGAITVTTVTSWYPTLVKPAWNPPARLFGPVWSALYLLMAVSAWLVWRGRDEADVRVALALYGIQLALNLIWTLLFFGLRRPAAALADIALLWCAILATVGSFWSINATAAALLVPYLAWVTFASVLNLAIVRLNRTTA